MQGCWLSGSGSRPALATGALVGWLMGVIIAYTGAHPILVSLSMMIFVRGLGEFLTRGGDVSGMPEFWSRRSARARRSGFRIPLLILVACRGCYGTSSCRAPASASRRGSSGPTSRRRAIPASTRAACWCWSTRLSGAMCAVAGIVMLARFNSVRVGHGESYVLITVLACFLGGVDPFGGFGRVLPLAIALVILQVIASGLNQIGASQHLATALWGAFLLDRDGVPFGLEEPLPADAGGAVTRDRPNPSTLGIDAGTSSVKVVAGRSPIDPGRHGRTASPASAETVLVRGRCPNIGGRPSSQPSIGWPAASPGLFGRVEGIGLSGPDARRSAARYAADRPVRPAILWNDGRSAAEAEELARHADLSSHDSACRPMPGFTGPKMLWLRRHEPETLDRTRHLLLPKDFLRLKLTGERITDVSDAAGTWLLDQARRDLVALRRSRLCGVDPDWLPGLVESTAVAGRLRSGMGLALGSQARHPRGGWRRRHRGGGRRHRGRDRGPGVSCRSGPRAKCSSRPPRPRPDPDRMTHAFCHALPGLWYSMAAMLNGASPVGLGGALDRTPRCRDPAVRGRSRLCRAVFDFWRCPYLFGERTPHNDPDARGALIGLTGSTSADRHRPGFPRGNRLLAPRRARRFGADRDRGPTVMGFIGGGSRSRFWGSIIASVLGITLVRYEGAERGPAFGAARLAPARRHGRGPGHGRNPRLASPTRSRRRPA